MLRRATLVHPTGHWPQAESAGSVTLAFDDRFRRRIQLNDDSGEPFLLDLARAVVLNSKTRRTGICGAAECLLIDWRFYTQHGPVLIEDLLKAGVEVRTEGELLKVPGTVRATPEDFGREFLDMVIAANTVTVAPPSTGCGMVVISAPNLGQKPATSMTAPTITNR